MGSSPIVSPVVVPLLAMIGVVSMNKFTCREDDDDDGCTEFVLAMVLVVVGVETKSFSLLNPWSWLMVFSEWLCWYVPVSTTSLDAPTTIFFSPWFSLFLALLTALRCNS